MTIIQPLTPDERAVLEIAAHGQPLAAIGRWEAPCASLVAKGYLVSEGRANNWITQAGKDAWRETEAADEADWRALEGKLAANANAQADCVAAVEKLVLPLVLVSRVSARVTGDSPEFALRKWMDELREECLRRLRSGE